MFRLFSLILIIALSVSGSASAQKKSDTLFGEWVPVRENTVSFDKIVFYPDGLLNIVNENAKMLGGYKITSRSGSYLEGQMHSGRWGRTIQGPSFTVVFKDSRTMVLNIFQGNKTKSYDLKKMEDIKYGIIPARD